ncbi:MAG: DNA translocase FtsK [Oscillospiraceae bacterium]|nr:DNA translocase FtsK [Oscillospiraceae bacterium]
MATAQKRNSGGKRAAPPGGRGKGRNPSKRPKPVRREIGAVVCLLLAIFSGLGVIFHGALFIDFFCGSVKGLIGYGFWLLPVMLLVSSGVLALHRGRPVRLRVWCAMLTPILFGAFLHLILAKGDYTWSFELIKTLWTQGQSMKSGGVLSGMIALGFSGIFSRAGAGIVFVLAGLFMLMASFNVTIVDVVDYLRDLPRPEYEEEPLPPPRQPREPKERRPAPPPKPERRSRAAIDIPVDEGPLIGQTSEPEPKKKDRLFNRTPSVPTPDQVLTGAVHRPEPVPEPEPAPDPAPALNLDPELEPDFVPPAELDPICPPEPVSDLLEPPLSPVPEPPAPPIPEIIREPAVPKAKPAETAQAVREISQDIAKSQSYGPDSVYQCPPISLLREGGGPTGADVAGELRANQARLADTIHSFGIDASMVDVTRGPSVTRYELELDQGVRLNKLINLSDDIALALGATGVRVAAVPGKISTVGIEVPNQRVSPVNLRDVIHSDEFRDHKSKTAFAVGKDISGNNVVGSIADLTHMLIAGTTGSGKSVCTNSLIISLLYKAAPEEVRLIMVDPKMVELGIYNGIPHLLIPVVTDPKKAAGALQWAVSEMMKRYTTFSELGVRDLASYNAKAAHSEELNTLPSIVVIIDELADLMLVAAKEVEESICRVAQMGRAAGMHLVIATQRPSADVITGLMKANIPSRIAFAVASSLESRIILDNPGAEKLVGRGDMLYQPRGSNKPQRIQGCFISDEEVADVVAFVKQNSGSAEYDKSIIHEIEQHAAAKEKGSRGGSALDSTGDDYDELLPSAIEVVVELGVASVSMLQRRLKVGFSRAARLVDQMEENGIVGPSEGSKPRQVLISKDQWQEMQFRQNMVDRGPSTPEDRGSDPVPEELDYESDAIPQSRDQPPF